MRLVRAAAALLLVQPLGGCLAAGNRVSDVVGIPLREGTNPIARFAPDGRSGMIVAARAQDGLSVSHLYLVMLPRLSPDRGWDVVGTIDPATGRTDQELSTGGRDFRAIRFARGKVGGLPSTLMFVAHPDRPGYSQVEIDTYRLSTDGEDGSGMSAAFDRIGQTRTWQAYCTPEAALEDVDGLDPVPGTPIASCPQA